VRAFLALLPFALVPALLATGRVGALASGLAGLLAALAAAALLQAAPPATVAVALASDVAEGAWLALQAALFIVAGLFFHLAVQAARDGPGQATALPAARTGFDRRRLFAACFLLGPFLESATGFGVGQVMAVPAILAAGASGLPAVGLSLLTQSLVAWGSLGVGSAVGATLAGVGFHDLQLRTALLMAPVLIGHVPVFWGLLRAAGCPSTRTDRVDDLAWAGLLAGGLVATSVLAPPELGALLACGCLLVLRSGRDSPALFGRGLVPALRQAAPYAALVLILLATRTVTPLRDELQALWVLRPFAGQPPLAPFYHPAAWLALVAVAVLASSGRFARLASVLNATSRGAWRAVLVTVVFVVLARVAAAGGLAVELAHGAELLLGGATVLLAPLLGALSGALTGSNTASNGLMMPVQVALARAAGADPAWAAAMQNAAGSSLCMLSPTRVATGCALFGVPGTESRAYKLAWPLGVVAIIVLAVCWMLALAW